jgi:hypothetical protein
VNGVAAAALLVMTPVAGQEVVELPGEDRRLGADFEEVFRIGSFDGDTWETFGEIGGAVFDARGNLYVFDRQASRITVVDRDGAFVREIGQVGEGPGEFRSAVAFTVTGDGRVVVADIGHRSYQIFGSDGAFERMVSMGDGDMIRVGELAPALGGDAVISGGGGRFVAMRTGPEGDPSTPRSRPIERISLTGDRVVVDTIAEGWQPPRAAETPTLEGGGMRLRMTMAGASTFEPELLVGVLPDGGVAFADSSTFAIKIAGPTGGVSRILRRPFPPAAVTERMQAAERERRLAELDAGEGPRMQVMMRGPGGGGAQPIGQDAIREMMRGRIEQMQFYPELPVLVDVRTSWTGKVWAQRRGAEPVDPGPIDVMTPAGQYVGTFPIGTTEIPTAFGPDGLAAYVEADEFDVPVIVVRRLPDALN